MKFLRIKCQGLLNSFRQPDFHTYHKTLPLPPKTTVAGMLGSALGIPPETVNTEWLIQPRFKMGVVGQSGGKANDLWQIRKYESKQIGKFYKGEELTPYKTAVIVRELLYDSVFTLYLYFEKEEDYDLIYDRLLHPSWALSLGREDELIKIDSLAIVDLPETHALSYQNTVLPVDLSAMDYSLDLHSLSGNLISEAPRPVTLPMAFQWNFTKDTREAVDLQSFSYVFNVPVRLSEGVGFWDEEFENAFQIF